MVFQNMILMLLNRADDMLCWYVFYMILSIIYDMFATSVKGIWCWMMHKDFMAWSMMHKHEIKQLWTLPWQGWWFHGCDGVYSQDCTRKSFMSMLRMKWKPTGQRLPCMIHLINKTLLNKNLLGKGFPGMLCK
jgi:hypothetical protein